MVKKLNVGDKVFYVDVVDGKQEGIVKKTTATKATVFFEKSGYMDAFTKVFDRNFSELGYGSYVLG